MDDPKVLCVGLAGDVSIPPGAGVLSCPSSIERTRAVFLEPFANCQAVVCNFEAPLTSASTTRANKTYNLKSAPQVLDLLDSRFVVSLANNHIMDYGELGLLDTISALRERGIVCAGAGRNIAEASEPAFVTCQGHRLAVICAADPRFQCAGRSKPGVSPATPDRLHELIVNSARMVDHVLVSIHAGMEFTRVPTPYMRDIADRCLSAGAGIVQFHHAHCLSGMTQEDSTLVIWGAGNYAFPYCLPSAYPPWFDAGVWKVTFGERNAPFAAEFVPILLSSQGIPGAPDEHAAKRIRRTVDACSLRIARKRNLRLWQICSVLHPAYVSLSTLHYIDMARRTGIGSVLRFLLKALKVHVAGRHVSGD